MDGQRKKVVKYGLAIKKATAPTTVAPNEKLYESRRDVAAERRFIHIILLIVGIGQSLLGITLGCGSGVARSRHGLTAASSAGLRRAS
jgi:hypothetical protein